MESNRKIEVCHIISGDLWAGAEAQAYTMMTALMQLPEIELSAIVLNPGKLATRLLESGVMVTVIDESKYSFLQILKRTETILAARQVKIVHSHRYKENLIAGILKRRGCVPALVQTVHGLQERQGGWRQLKVAAYGKLNAYISRSYFDRILAVSEDIFQRSLPQYGCDTMRHVPNAIHLEDVKTDKSPAAVRRKLGIDPHDLVIGTVGRMVPIKGFDIFLRTAQRVLQSRAGTRFLMVGDGPKTLALKELSHQLGIRENVMFTGFCEDIFDVMSVFDIFMMTSWHEGIPVALLEAMALRKPTVSTAVGGVGEVLENEKSGLLAKAGDVDALAACCERLLASLEQRTAMGLQARLRVETEYSTLIQRERLRKIYRELAGN